MCERVTHLFKHTERVQKATGKASENSRKDMVSASAIRVRCRAETAKTLEPSPVHELHGQDMVYSTLYIVGSKPYQSPVLFAPPSHTACSNGSRRCLLHCLRLRRITLSSITHLSTAGSVKAMHVTYRCLVGCGFCGMHISLGKVLLWSLIQLIWRQIPDTHFGA